jgi:hypothetical protein
MKKAVTVNVSNEGVLKKIAKIINTLPNKHVEIRVNRRGICMELGNWAYNWVNKFQRTSSGFKSAQWGVYEQIIKGVHNRLPFITTFTPHMLLEEEEKVEMEERT